MRHRRKKRTNDVKRSTNLVVRFWHWLVKLFKEYDQVQKELGDLGIYFNFSSLGGGFFSYFDTTAEKLDQEDVSSRSRKRRRNSND